MRHRLKDHQHGFTIIELSIASLVFSTVLVLITIGLLRVGSAFSKSVSNAKVQESAQIIMDDITDAVRFSGEEISTPIQDNNGWAGFCIGDRRYSYRPPTGGVSSDVMVVDTADSCNSTTLAQDLSGGWVTGTNLLREGTFLAGFQFELVPGSSDAYRLFVGVYAASDPVNDVQPTPTGSLECRLDTGGAEFCSVTRLSTIVQKRIE